MTRRRRDLRAERATHAVAAGGRLRFDLQRRKSRDAVPERSLTQADTAAPAPKKIVIVEEPACYVWVVPDAIAGRLSTHDRQLFGAARSLAGAEGAVVALADELCESMCEAGADRRLDMFSHMSTAYDPEAQAQAIASSVVDLEPKHVVFAETADGGDLARRVASLLGEPLFGDAEAVGPQRVRRAASNQRIEQSAAPPRLISIMADAVAPYAGAPREARTIDASRVRSVDFVSRISEAALLTPDPATVPLAEADFVAAAGNGVTDFAIFHRVVAALNATPGASRVLCDAGTMPRDRQVGASGTVLAATCYLALGIAGAPQHLQGVANCDYVIAVNTDLHAAMIKRADLAIVQDVQLVMPALLAALEQDAVDPGQ